MMYLGSDPVGLNAIHCRMASGEFTQVSGVAYLNHNLGTKKVFVVMQRVNSDHSNINENSNQYQSVLVFGATKEALGIDTEQTYSFNNGTQAKWDAANELSNQAYPKGVNGYFPSATASSPGSGSMAYAYRGVTAEDAQGPSDNTVRIYPVYTLYPGRWVWRAYALD